MRRFAGLSRLGRICRLVAAAWAGIIWISPLPASAHAIIIKSEPAAGSTVTGPKMTIRLQYNSRIDAHRSRLAIKFPDGRERTLSLLAQPGVDSLAAEADQLTPGAYRLHWQVLSVDGHITRGDIPFQVIEPAK